MEPHWKFFSDGQTTVQPYVCPNFAWSAKSDSKRTTPVWYTVQNFGLFYLQKKLHCCPRCEFNHLKLNNNLVTLTSLLLPSAFITCDRLVSWLIVTSNSLSGFRCCQLYSFTQPGLTKWTRLFWQSVAFIIIHSSRLLIQAVSER